MSTKYHSYGSCPKCGGDNEVSVVGTVESHVSECETVCTVCGYQGYWSFGFFEIEDFEFKGVIYSF